MSEQTPELLRITHDGEVIVRDLDAAKEACKMLAASNKRSAERIAALEAEVERLNSKLLHFAANQMLARTALEGADR